MQRNKVERQTRVTVAVIRYVNGADKSRFSEEEVTLMNRLKGKELEGKARAWVKANKPEGSVFIEILSTTYYTERREMSDQFFYENSILKERKEEKA